MLLSDLLVRYFAQNVRIRHENTRRQYRYALRDWTELLGRDPTIADLTDENLGQFANWLLAKNLEPKTVNERTGRIAALWRWLVKVGELRRMPLIDRVREPRRAPIAWSSGERISALMAVRWEWIVGEFLTIPAEVRKGRASDRVYRLSAESLAALESIRQPVRTLVWSWPYAPSYLWIRYKVIRQRAGLPTDRRSSFHRLRKSVASHAKRLGGDPTALLDHISPHVTQSYLDPRVCPPPMPADYLPDVG